MPEVKEQASSIKRRNALLCHLLLAMFGAIMFASKLIMALLPNIHLLGMLIMVLTLTFRRRALISIYIFVAIEGIYAAASGTVLWWIPYLYIWTILWGITMLIPRSIPKGVAAVVYPAVCALHGFAFGTLYAPAQALLFGLSFKATLAWIVAGIPFDVIHGISNIFTGALVLPLSILMQKLLNKSGIRL